MQNNIFKIFDDIYSESPKPPKSILLEIDILDSNSSTEILSTKISDIFDNLVKTDADRYKVATQPISGNSDYNNDINNLKEVDKSNLTEIIEYNKIRLKCINKKESKIINDLIISYMALFGLLLIAYI